MEINGTQLIEASQQLVWDSLNNPDILKKCLPSCESVEAVSAEEFKIVLTAAVGPMRIRFKGMLSISDAKPPSSCHMAFEGQGGVAGFGKGTADVDLQKVGGGTQLNYQATAQVGGKLAQVGTRLIDGVAKKIADDFFIAFRKELSGENNATSVNATVIKASGRLPELGTLSKGSDLSTSNDGRVSNGVPAWWLIVALFSGAAIAIGSARLIN
jgi:carbon monoxide dehydrogenase subunit G